MDKSLDYLTEYITAKANLDKAKADCNSSWGYYLHDEIERVELLKQKITDELTGFIDDRINAAKQKRAER